MDIENYQDRLRRGGNLRVAPENGEEELKRAG
jgi:hypothetical protein